MQISTLFLTLATSTWAGSVAAQWNNNKTWIFNLPGRPAEEWLAGQDLIKELPKHCKSSKPWDAGFLPLYCKEETMRYKLDPKDVETRDVFYSDCAAPWVICRHKDSLESWDHILETLGKVPVGMRQYQANMLVIPDVAGKTGPAWAWNTSQTYSNGSLTPTIMVHEFSHTLDSIALNETVVKAGYPEGTWYSATRMWAEAWARDTAVPTQYSNTNEREGFAEVGRYTMSHMIHAGGLASYNPEWVKIRNQVEHYESVLRRVIFPEGGRCTGKIPSSPRVPAAADAVVSASFASSVSGDPLRGVPEIRVPAGVFDDIIEHKHGL